MYIKGVSCISESEYKSADVQGLTFDAVNTDPAQGHCAYITAERAVKVNANRGYFRSYLDRVLPGDIIHVSFDCKNISGVKVHAGIDFGSTAFDAVLGTSGAWNSKKSGEWEHVEFDYISPFDTYYCSVMVGLSTGEVGVYMVRDFHCTVETVRIPSIRRIFGACIKKISGSFAVTDNSWYLNDGIVVTTVDANSIEVSFNSAHGVTFAPFHWCSQEEGNPYIIRTKANLSPGKVLVKFYDYAGAVVPLANIANGVVVCIYCMAFSPER